MTQALASALGLAHERRNAILSELREFIRLPSISSDPAHEGDVARAADWLASRDFLHGHSNVVTFNFFDLLVDPGTKVLKSILPFDDDGLAVDARQGSADEVVVSEDALVAHLLVVAEESDVELLDDVDAVNVVDAHLVGRGE